MGPRRLLLLFIVGAAHAAPNPEARLIYVRESGAERCPEEAEVRAAVGKRLGYEPFGARGTTISVALAKGPKGLLAKIELVGALGEVTGARELASPKLDCAELAQAVELAISLAIDPLSFAGPAEPTAAPVAPEADDPNRAKPPRLKPAVAVKVAPPVVEDNRLRLRLSAGALASLGTAPGVAFGFTAQVGVRRRRWSVSLEARADLPSSQPAAGGVVTTAIYTAGALPCFHQGMFAGCALVELGGQVSSGAGFPVSVRTTTLFAAGGVRAAIEIPLGRRVELHLAADLLAAITRARLFADDIEVFPQPPVSGAFHVALAGHVP